MTKMPLFRRLPELAPRRHTPEMNSYAALIGVHAAVLTARELLVDAGILFQFRRWPRAAALSALAIEEVGKVQVLMDAVHMTPAAVKKVWEDYHRHPVKGSFAFKRSELPENERYAAQLADGRRLDLLKQCGFYSALTKSGKWTTPDESVTEGDARLALGVAQYMVEQLQDWESIVFPNGAPKTLDPAEDLDGPDAAESASDEIRPG